MSRSNWLEVRKRDIYTTSTEVRDGQRIEVRLKRQSKEWYGRRQVNGKWGWTKLFVDKRSSQQKWNDIIRQAELRDSGVVTAHMDELRRPISEHLADYKADLKRRSSIAHFQIASRMLDRFIAIAGWKTLADIDEKTAGLAIDYFASKGKTVSYTNAYLARMKGFLNWLVPSRLVANPLQKMRRGNIKKARKVRARRPLSETELSALLRRCGDDRRIKYAIPIFTGLRRKELSQLLWADLHLDSIIPHIHLRPEIAKTGDGAFVPLHPYLVAELRKLPQAMPGVKLFVTLPEGRTMLRDLTRASIQQTDALGRRADYHALRHCFAKRLDETGCSHATRRALMRHGSGDQTDEYTLARQKELYDAILRLPYPVAAEDEAVQKTGTDDAPTDSLYTDCTNDVPRSTAIDRDVSIKLPTQLIQNTRKNQGNDNHCPQSTVIVLSDHRNADIVAESGPRSSIG